MLSTDSSWGLCRTQTEEGKANQANPPVRRSCLPLTSPDCVGVAGCVDSCLGLHRMQTVEEEEADKRRRSSLLAGSSQLAGRSATCPCHELRL